MFAYIQLGVERLGPVNLSVGAIDADQMPLQQFCFRRTLLNIGTRDASDEDAIVKKNRARRTCARQRRLPGQVVRFAPLGWRRLDLGADPARITDLEYSIQWIQNVSPMGRIDDD